MAPGQALERARPQEQALIQVATELGIVKYAEGGGMLIDLTSPELHAKYNVLAPAATIAKGDANFTPAVSVVTLNADPNAGDFYEIEKPKAASGNYAAKAGAYALSKRALDVIGKLAGIEDIGPVVERDGHDITLTWRCQVRRPDGTMQQLAGTREWIEEDEKALLEAQIPDWATKGESARAKWWNENWYGRVKRFRLPMCESKARLRAYRQALTLKSKYSPDEIRKPFLVVSTTFTPDTSDLRILGMLMSQGQQAAGLLYGAPTVSDDTGEYLTGEVIGETAETVDKATGELSGTETHGERPAEDRQIPRGPCAGMMLSEACQKNPVYVRAHILKTVQLGPLADLWLHYWYGSEGDDLSDISF